MSQNANKNREKISGKFDKKAGLCGDFPVSVRQKPDYYAIIPFGI